MMPMSGYEMLLLQPSDYKEIAEIICVEGLGL